MRELYEECVAFFTANLQAIVATPVDTSCLPPAICAHIAGLVSPATLTQLEVCGCLMPVWLGPHVKMPHAKREHVFRCLLMPSDQWVR